MVGVSLMEVFERIPDPRDLRGQRHPLAAVLGLTALALLAGMKSLEAIAQFGRNHGPALAHALGFRRGKTPCKSTLSILFRAIDLDAFEQGLQTWLASRHADGWPVIAIDGKAVRGSGAGEAPGIHLLAAYAPQAAAVLAQLQVGTKTNEHKAALRLLGILPKLNGAVVTGDAMFTHRDVCTEVRGRGGDYLLPVKDNQPNLQAEITAAFTEPADFSPLSATA